jgi:hypothetical protein
MVPVMYKSVSSAHWAIFGRPQIEPTVRICIESDVAAVVLVHIGHKDVVGVQRSSNLVTIVFAYRSRYGTLRYHSNRNRSDRSMSADYS